MGTLRPLRPEELLDDDEPVIPPTLGADDYDDGPEPDDALGNAPDKFNVTRHDEDLANLAEKPWPVGIGDRVRYNRATRRWYAWRGFYWSSDEAHAYNLLVSRARQWIALPALTQDERAAVLTLFDVRKQESVMKALSRRETIRLNGDEFDQVPYLFAFRNGVMDLRTGAFSRTGDPADYVSKRSAVKWDPNATIPARWKKFLLEIMSNDPIRADYLGSVLGYSLFGHQREQKFWIWAGQGQNGKGTLARVMSYVMGEYDSAPDRQLFTRTSRNGKVSADARPDLLKLMHTRWAWMSEPSGEFDDELLKAHSGDDPVTARDLYKGSEEYVTFRPTYTILFLVNKAPKTNDIGVSFQRRVRVIKFREDFTLPDPVTGAEREDKDLEKSLKAEAAGIMRYLVARAVEYSARGALAPEPQDVTDESDRYIAENDQLVDYLAEWCVVGQAESSSARTMLDAYRAWADYNLVPALERLSEQDLGAALVKRFERQRKGHGRVQTYFGVRPLRTDELADMGVTFDDDGRPIPGQREPDDD